MNDNIIHLIFAFLNECFGFIQNSNVSSLKIGKSIVKIDKNLKECLIKGLSEIIIKVVSKFSLTSDYLNVILKEFSSNVLQTAGKSDMEVVIKTILIVLLNKV